MALDLQPLVHTTWAEWLAIHPDTLVPEWETPYTNRYRDVTPGGGNLGRAFQESLLNDDDRLERGQLVLGAGVGADFRAYVLDDFSGQLSVLADELGGFPIVVFLNPERQLRSGVFGRDRRNGAGVSCRRRNDHRR